VESYALAIKSAIKRECNLKASIGIAPTKSSAKIASKIPKPDGLTIFYPTELQQFLENLEVENIAGIGTKTQRSLESMGILTIGQLANCDVQILMDKFGKKNGLWMWQAANDKDEDPVVTREDHVTLSNERTLGSFTKDKDVIERFLLDELVGELYERLSNQGYGYKSVAIKIVRSDFSIESREFSFSKYQVKKEGITSVLEGLLQKFSLMDDDGQVRKVGLKVSKLTRIKDKKSLKTNQKSLLDYY
jgi:DNA polymerase IV (DinB-like DNA polymerase)